jgi:hypothetical protein
MIVNTGYCADDGSDRPLIQRTVITCNGVVTSGVYELDGAAYVGSVKRCDPQCCPDGVGSVGKIDPIDREKITVGASVVTLVPPIGTDLAWIENIPVPGNGRVRWTDTGTAPSGGGASGFGHFLIPGTSINYTGDVSAFSMIRDASQNAVIEVTYYAFA